MTLRVATPWDEPQPALVATCANCPQRRILRLGLESAKWRHDDGSVTCPEPPPGDDDPAAAPELAPAAPSFDDLLKGGA